MVDTLTNDVCIVAGAPRRNLKTGTWHQSNAVRAETEVRVFVPQRSVSVFGCLKHAYIIAYSVFAVK